MPGSPKHELRVMLHLEIARAEAEAEFYKKAAQHVEAALRLDVPLDARGERPLDVPLLQMRTKLALKTDIYRDAETAEEKAMLLFEQALYLPISPYISLYLPASRCISRCAMLLLE